MGAKFNPLIFSGIDFGGTSAAPGGSPYFKDPVANYVALPTIGNSLGDVRVTTDDGKLYWWNSSEWRIVPGMHTPVYTLNGTDITNKYVTLPFEPANSTNALVLVSGGPMQIYSVDYTITGSQLGWNGLGLDGVLESGDVIHILYT